MNREYRVNLTLSVQSPSSVNIVQLMARRFPLSIRRVLQGGRTETVAKVVGGGRLLVRFIDPWRIQAEFWPKREEGRRELSRQDIFAIMSGLHSRLGDQSPLRALDDSIMREHIIRAPVVLDMADEDDFCRFLMRFTEGEEAVIDTLFLDQDDESLYDDELSLWFHVAPGSMQAYMRYADNALEIVTSEEDQQTGETTMMLYANNDHDDSLGCVYLHFSPSSHLIMVSGLGTEVEEERRSSFREPDMFKYFVDRLRERIQEARGEDE
jgi:hypothetical protein